MELIAILFRFYSIVVLLYVISSWLPIGKDNPIVTFLGTAVEPALKPIQQILPDTGGIDFSPIILLLGLNFMARMLLGG